MNDHDATRAQAASIYRRLLEAWNQRSADDFAALFGASGSCVGFDGSSMNGRSEIATQLGAIFAQHPTASYVAKVREIRSVAEHVTLVQAVAGMIPPGKSELNPAVNAIQNVIIVRSSSTAHIALFQNTPAAFHGRPEMSESLTRELSAVAHAGRVVDTG